MDHQEIAAEATVERYVSGDLSDTETVAFEEHYLSCPQCLDELADTQRLREGLRDLVNSGELARPVMAPAGSWWQSPVWAAAATVMLGVSVTSTAVMYQKLQQTPGLVPGAAEVYDLVAVRSGPGDPPINTVQPDNSGHTLVFLIDTGRIDDYGPFSVTISAETATLPPITIEPLVPGSDSRLAISLPASRLPAGDYRVEVREPGNAAVLNTVRFRMTHPR